MYILEAYNTGDTDKLINFIEENSFADLVTFHDGTLSSNKVPFFYDTEKNELYGHFGRSNPQLIELENSNEVLVIFSGAHSYISPQWYISKNKVPTWNFQTLQVRGKASIVDDKELLRILAKLTKFHESKLENQWTMSKLDPNSREKMLDMITGFKVEITDIKFKEKMSQIRDVEDQKSIISALNKTNEPSAKKVANIMTENIESE